MTALAPAGLRSYSRRLRKSDAAHAQEIANSIGAFGFSIPLLICKENVVIDGEVRLEAARLLALTSVPCIRIDHLSEDEQRLLRLAANRLGEKGSWDLEGGGPGPHVAGLQRALGRRGVADSDGCQR